MEGKELYEEFAKCANKYYDNFGNEYSWRTLDNLDKQIWNELATKLELKKV